MAIGRVNTGGGGSGGTLVVTGVAGHTVTATKGDKAYTRTINPQGKATFKGLATGEWTVTMQGGGQTATRRVTITADYAVTITYFAATLNITYPANSKCTVSNAAGQQIATDANATASPKTWACTVGAADTYTITAESTAGDDKAKSTTAQITSDGQAVAVTLTYEQYLIQDGVSLVEYKAETAHILTEGKYLLVGFDTSVDWLGTGSYVCELDVTDYETLYVYGYTSYGNAGAGPATVTVGTASVSIGSEELHALDISKITGIKKIKISASARNTETQGWQSSTAHVKNMWLA